MKRAMILVCSLLLMFSLATCGTNGNDRQPEDSPAPSSPVEMQSGGQTDAPDTSAPAQVGSDELPGDSQNTPAATEPVESESTPPSQAQPTPPSSGEDLETQEPESEISSEENETMQMNVQVGGTTFSATLEENTATEAFVELMKNAPVVIQMSDYSGFEKVGSLGTSLPTSNSQTTTQSGDIVLYNGNQIVIFYGSNSWSYTRLGKIDDLTGWVETLGTGDVTVTFSVN